MDLSIGLLECPHSVATASLAGESLPSEVEEVVLLETAWCSLFFSHLDEVPIGQRDLEFAWDRTAG